MVDLRHDATHGELPTLPVLRRAAADALAWLDAHYWQPQVMARHRTTSELVPEAVQVFYDMQRAAVADRAAAEVSTHGPCERHSSFFFVVVGLFVAGVLSLVGSAHLEQMSPPSSVSLFPPFVLLPLSWMHPDSPTRHVLPPFVSSLPWSLTPRSCIPACCPCYWAVTDVG